MPRESCLCTLDSHPLFPGGKPPPALSVERGRIMHDIACYNKNGVRLIPGTGGFSDRLQAIGEAPFF